MDSKKRDEAYSEFVDSMSYGEAGRALLVLTRTAFFAGWEAAKRSQEENKSQK